MNIARNILLLVLSFASFSSAVLAQDAAAFETFSTKAGALAHAGKHADAITFYKAAVEEAEKFGKNNNDRLVSTLRKMAASYQAMKDITRANACLQRALSVLTEKNGSLPGVAGLRSDTRPSSATGIASIKKGSNSVGRANPLPRAQTIPLSPAAHAGDADSASITADFGPYMLLMQKRVKELWQPPKGEENRKVVVAFTVDSQGAVSNLSIKRSSGVSAADDAALKAIKEAAPFPPMPQGSKTTALDVQFELNYNVHRQSTGDPSPKFEDAPPAAGAKNEASHPVPKAATPSGNTALPPAPPSPSTPSNPNSASTKVEQAPEKLGKPECAPIVEPPPRTVDSLPK